MTYLRAVLKESEWEEVVEPASKPVAVVSPGVSDVVYVDDDASTATITAALQAWGLRVRAEREHGHAGTKGLERDAAWTTTRPDWPPQSRLLNFLSPVWLPGFEREVAASAAPAEQDISSFAWFARAA